LLGVPTVPDRLIQQAIAQIPMPIFDPGFSGSSFGFRPGRSAHQAVRVAQRVLDSVTDVVGRRLKLKVNREKSSVRHAREATLLGFGFYFSRSGVRIRVDPKAIERLKARIRELTCRRWSVSMPCRIDKLNRFTTGWMAYFRLADLGNRSAAWTNDSTAECGRAAGRNGNYSAKRRNLRQLGIPELSARRWAASSKGHWRIAGSAVLQRALPKTYWDDLDLLALQTSWQRLRPAA
jgi:RNA-directed DNA polymerase